MDELKHKLEIRAWTMYDWANSAFATTVMGAILPTYFSAYIAAGRSLSLWGYTVAIGSLLAALISPILGAIADFRGSKKKFMAIFVALGVISTGLALFSRYTRRMAALLHPLYLGHNRICWLAGILRLASPACSPRR